MEEVGDAKMIERGVYLNAKTQLVLNSAEVLPFDRSWVIVDYRFLGGS